MFSLIDICLVALSLDRVHKQLLERFDERYDERYAGSPAHYACPSVSWMFHLSLRLFANVRSFRYAKLSCQF